MRKAVKQTLTKVLSSEKVWAAIIAGVFGVITIIVTIMLNWYMNRKDFVHDVDSHIEQNEEITKILEEINDNLGSTTSMVYQFTNGENYYTGKEIQKFQITNFYPFDQPLYAREINRVPVSLHNDMFVSLRKNMGSYYIQSIDTEEKVKSFNYLYEKHGITSSYTVWLKGKSYLTYYGGIMIHWDEPHDLDSLDMEFIQDKADKIYDLISKK